MYLSFSGLCMVLLALGGPRLCASEGGRFFLDSDEGAVDVRISNTFESEMFLPDPVFPAVSLTTVPPGLTFREPNRWGFHA